MIDVEAQSAGILGKILVWLHSKKLLLSVVDLHLEDAGWDNQRTCRASNCARS